MIPVRLESEPEFFAEQVTNPGTQFLGIIPHPTSDQWKGKEYWQIALPDMRIKYKGMCAYCAHWIPHSTGNHSIDHFLPKSQNPELAYVWSNFRYVSARFNSRKGTRPIIDPFLLSPNWFTIDFSSFLIRPHSALQSQQKEDVNQTIKILQLNSDDDLVFERQTWFIDYLKGEITLEHLKRHAPFIAYELERQDLLRNLSIPKNL